MKKIPAVKLYLLIFLTALLFVLSKVAENQAQLGYGTKMAEFIIGSMISIAIALIVVFLITVINLIRTKANR